VAKIIDEWSAKGATIDTRDGVRIDTNDFWVQMRKSNTEPIVRVIGEAKDANRAKEVCEEFMGRIK
jgi:phosphomannomutase